VNNGKPEDLQLFDLSKDPFALNNVIEDFPDVRKELETKYSEWIKEMRRINPLDLPLYVGTDHEPETVLTSQDAKEIDAKSKKSEWRLNVVESGIYRIGISDKTFNGPITADLLIDNELVATLTTNESKDRYFFDPIELDEGRRTLKVIPHERETRFLHVFVSKQDQ
jgi:hypothetical protein